MKNVFHLLCFLLAASLLSSHLPAEDATAGVKKKIADNTITEDLVFPSGKTLTIGAGATLDATGATVTGLSTGAAWGAITGTLSSQTDLQTALNAKSPLASPTFTGTVTIPSGASIAGYLTSATAASTYAPLASPTFTGTATIPSVTSSGIVQASQFNTSGNISSAAWTTGGLRFYGTPGTLTDTSSSGTVAAAYTNKFGGETIASSSATTFTNYLSLYVSEPVAGSNVTFTNKYALGADSLRVGTSNALTVSTTGVLSATSPVFTTPALGTTAYAPIFGGTTTGGPVQSGTVGTSGQVLTSNGAGALPTFQNSGSGVTVANDGGVTIGLTATNGSAATARRSDGTPALSQSIVPTWTGAHTFTPTTPGTAITLNGGTITTSLPVLDMTQTWNSSGVTFTGLKLNVTSTASAAASLLMDLKVGGTSQFTVRKDGSVQTGSGNSTGDLFIGSTAVYVKNSGGGMVFSYDNFYIGSSSISTAKDTSFGWSSTTSSSGVAADTLLTRESAAVIQQGADSATPVAQTFKAPDARAGTDSNTAGTSITIGAGRGTGSAAVTGAVLNLQSPVAVASGTGAQTLTTGLQIINGTAKLTNYTVANLPSASTCGAGAMAFVTDANSTTTYATVAAGGSNKVMVISDGTNWIIH